MNTFNTLKEQTFDPEAIYKELNKGFFSNLIRSILKFFGFNQGLSFDFHFGDRLVRLLDDEIYDYLEKSYGEFRSSTLSFIETYDINNVENKKLSNIITLIRNYESKQSNYESKQNKKDYFNSFISESRQLLTQINLQNNLSSDAHDNLSSDAHVISYLRKFIGEVKLPIIFLTNYDYRLELDHISISSTKQIKPTIVSIGFSPSDKYMDEYRKVATFYKRWSESKKLDLESKKLDLESKKLLLLAYVKDYLQKCPYDPTAPTPKGEVMDYLKNYLECDKTSDLINTKKCFLISLEHSHGWGNGLFSTRVRDAVSMAYEIMKEEQFAEALDKIEDSTSLKFNDSESTLVNELKGYFTEGKNYRNSHDKIAHRLQKCIENSQSNDSANNAYESQSKSEFWGEMNKHYTCLLLADILRYKGNTVKTSVMEQLCLYLKNENDSTDALTALNTTLNATPDYDKGFFSQRVKTAVEAAKILKGDSKGDSNGPSLRT